MKSKKVNIVETDRCGGYHGLARGRKVEMLVQEYKFPVIR